MTSVLFWDITQRTVVVCIDVSGHPIGLIFKGQTAQI
jgi:hypothetical protein